MAVSKVVYSGDTLIDLTADTVSAGTLASGATAHDNAGNVITGNLSFVTVYSGTSEPAQGVGSDGDIYLKL